MIESIKNNISEEDFSNSLLIKSLENIGEIIFDKDVPYMYEDMELIKSYDFSNDIGLDLFKGKKAEVGTVRHWKSGSVQKQEDGKWKLVKKIRIVKGKEKKEKKAKRKPSKEFEQYRESVHKIDPDAQFLYLPGITAGTGVFVNKDKNKAYISSTKEGKRGTVIREIPFDKLKEIAQKRKKSIQTPEAMSNFYQVIPDEEINKILSNGPEIKTIAVTDPSVKYSGKESRTFRVAKSKYGDLIIDGSWKGYTIDDMLTVQQRLRGSAGYIVDPATGQAVRRHRRTKEGKRMVNVFHEAFCKYESGWAKIYVPYKDEYTKNLLKQISGINHLAKRGHIFKIPANRITEVVEKLGSVSLDKEMQNQLEKQLIKRSNALLAQYFDGNTSPQIAKLEDTLFDVERDIRGETDIKKLAILEKKRQSIEEEKYKIITEKASSVLDKEYKGFYRGIDIPGIKAKIGSNDLNMRFTQALALKAMVNKPNGAILGLDTGLGKTAVSIVYNMKMRELGKYHDGSNGKMCIVCNNSNINTWKNEINDFTEGGGDWKENPDGSLENNHFVVYPESKFNTNFGHRPNETMPEDKQKYLKRFGAIVVDEPQEYMKNVKSRLYSALANLDHPRKIISSESIMTKSPSEVIGYMQLADNNFDPEIRKQSIDQFNKSFKKEGKAIVIKSQEDEDRIKEIIRDNVIYYHKTDEPTLVFLNKSGKGWRMPKQRGEINGLRDSKTVTPPKAFIDEYNKISKAVAGTLENIYNDFSKNMGNPDKMNDKSFGDASSAFTKLREFTALPENFLPELNGKNPKIEAAVIDAKNHSENGRISLTFAKGPELTLKAAKRYSEVLGSNKLSICFTSKSKGQERKTKSIDPATKELSKYQSKITVWNNGKVIAEYDVKKDMIDAGLSMDDVMQKFMDENKNHSGKKWGSIHAPDSYNAGHNLQKSAHVIQHLDRDNWNPKVMYQRESRIIRPNKLGQVTYGSIHNYDYEQSPEMARTMDSIEKLKQMHEAKIFDRIIFGAADIDLAEPSVEIKTTRQVAKEAKLTQGEKDSFFADMGNRDSLYYSNQEVDNLHGGIAA